MLISKIKNNILSDLEWKVLMSYLDGKSYQEIAVELDRHIKSIDNALQRVKRKLEKYIMNRSENTDLSEVYSGLLAMVPVSGSLTASVIDNNDKCETK